LTTHILAQNCSAPRPLAILATASGCRPRRPPARRIPEIPSNEIDVILPVKHYVPRHLLEAVDSVMRQTAGTWQLLVMADVSVEAKVEALLRDALSDRRCLLFTVSTPNLAATINAGMERVTSNFVTLLLGDDLIADNTIEVLQQAIHDHPDADFFHSSRSVIDGEGNSISSVHPSRTDFVWNDFLYGSPVKHLLCWRLEAARAIGGVDETLWTSGPDDYDFPWRMFESGAVFRGLPECLYIYRNHIDGFRMTTHHPATIQLLAIRMILRKHGLGYWRSWFVTFRRWRMGSGSQSIYSSTWNRRLLGLVGYDASRSWSQQTYR